MTKPSTADSVCKYAVTCLRTSMWVKPLNSWVQELSKGIWHTHIGRFRGVIYRWKALELNFPMVILPFAYLWCIFCRRPWGCPAYILLATWFANLCILHATVYTAHAVYCILQCARYPAFILQHSSSIHAVYTAYLVECTFSVYCNYTSLYGISTALRSGKEIPSWTS